eukprot:5295260-Prymnesium_polylepis.1
MTRPPPHAPTRPCPLLLSQTCIATSQRRASTVASRGWRVVNSPDWYNSPAASADASVEGDISRYPAACQPCDSPTLALSPPTLLPYRYHPAAMAGVAASLPPSPTIAIAHKPAKRPATAGPKK